MLRVWLLAAVLTAGAELVARWVGAAENLLWAPTTPARTALLLAAVVPVAEAWRRATRRRHGGR